MTHIRMVDQSEWTGPIPHSVWRALRDQQGIEAVCFQVWGGGPVLGRRNAHLAQHAEGALAAGLRLAGGYCWPVSDTARALDWADSQLPDGLASLDFWGLDVERAGFATNIVRVTPGDVRACRDAGIAPWVYASPSSWADIMGNTRAFNDLPLWVARYPLGAPYTLPPRGGWPAWDPFGSFRIGGWTEAAAWQFQGTTRYGDESFDVNYVQADALGGDRMDPEVERQLDELNEAVDALEEALRRHWAAAAFAGLLGRLQGYALAGTDAPQELLDQVALVIGWASAS